MKAKRVNEANSYLTSPIFPRFIFEKTTPTRASFAACGLLGRSRSQSGYQSSTVHGCLGPTKVGRNRKKYESGLSSGYQRLLSDFFLPGHDIPETIWNSILHNSVSCLTLVCHEKYCSPWLSVSILFIEEKPHVLLQSPISNISSVQA